MKNLILSLICVLGAAATAQADGITWGTEVLFPIKTVRYEGRVYSGALIASDVERNNVSGVGQYLTIVNPRVLVYDMVMGLDKVFEIEYASSGNPLCLNLNKKYTQMAQPEVTHAAVALFVKKDEVVITKFPTSYVTKSAISCSSFIVRSR